MFPLANHRCGPDLIPNTTMWQGKAPIKGVHLLPGSPVSSITKDKEIKKKKKKKKKKYANTSRPRECVVNFARMFCVIKVVNVFIIV